MAALEGNSHHVQGHSKLVQDYNYTHSRHTAYHATFIYKYLCVNRTAFSRTQGRAVLPQQNADYNQQVGASGLCYSRPGGGGGGTIEAC